MPEFTFDASDLAACQRLAYTMRSAAANDAGGTHRTRRSGEGSDFLDFRPYTPGDDVRRIDWTVYARLREPYIRLLQHETSLYIHFLVDLSRSMAAGDAPSKVELACRLTCAMAYIGLRGGERVSVSVFSDRWTPLVTDLHGPARLPTMIDALRRAPLGDGSDIDSATDRLRARTRRRGLVVLLSDFLTTGGAEATLHRLLADRFRVMAIQTLDPIDWGTGLSGYVRLRDSESGRSVDLEITPSRQEAYRRRVQAYVERLESFCRRRGQSYVLASTRENWIVAAARVLREPGALR